MFNKKQREMKNVIRSFFLLFMTIIMVPGFAHVPEYKAGKQAQTDGEQMVSLRTNCVPSTSSTDMDINNVRARLLGGGDVWWDLNNGRYIYPKVDPASGQTEVSAIFAASVWLGGFDGGGNLKTAAQTYRQSGDDFWPGPLIEATGGTTEAKLCSDWDRHFKVNGVDIDIHLQNWEANKDPQTNLLDNTDGIPEDVLYWPGKGNPFFSDKFPFELPDNEAGLADFFDADEDGIYNPLRGDFPKIGIRGCDPNDPRYPDQMVFWIYNDAGNTHTNTNSPTALRMEVQVQAFAYATNDEVNDMTFQRYKLINRGVDLLDSTYFALWVDADLGCYVDDYIGCDTTYEGLTKDGSPKYRDLMYIYNEDVLDGQPGCACPGGVPTYCDQVPILGVDYFRGPLDLDSIIGYRDRIIALPDGTKDTIQEPIFLELGMSSFTYYNNSAVGNWPAPMTDPQNRFEYYNYMSGSWRDGTPLTEGGSGYNIQSTERTNFALPGAPNDPNAWSMCTAELDFGDRRTIQASGPFQLKPGAVNELIIGVVVVPDETYPCPSLDRLLFADGIAQALFDNCFDITDGPDAPDMDWIELDQKLIAVLTNRPDSTFRFNNNAFEAYEALDLLAPTTIPEEERYYKFEGYKIFQLANANVGASELTDPSKARLVQQVDIKNGVSKIYNWRELSFPGVSEVVWLPTLMVDGGDQGIRHTFVFTEDQFSSAAIRTLINHRDYYYMVVSYAHNSHGEFLPSEPLEGQRKPYLEGRRNIKQYKVTPRPITEVTFQSEYGDGFVITRLDGAGAGGQFLDLELSQYDHIWSPEFDGTLVYRPGRGPIQVKVYNPFAVKDGTYRLFTEDENPGLDGVLSDAATWRLEFTDAGGNVVVSRPQMGLSRFNEQVFAEYGIAISIGQTPNAGVTLDERNGFIGGEIEYLDPTKPEWFTAAVSDDINNFSPTADFNHPNADVFFANDPQQGFSNVIGGTWTPYILTDFNDVNNPTLISPAWMNTFNDAITKNGWPINNLQRLPNVDVVFTSDRSRWSRCIVVETGAQGFYGAAFPSEGGVANFRLRDHASLEREPDANGNPQYDTSMKGMGWFPGYAIDVETGRRLNIFYGENSRIVPEMLQNIGIPTELNPPFITAQTRDMIWNPSDEGVKPIGFTPDGMPIIAPDFAPISKVYGGQHNIYVTWEDYDACDSLRFFLNRPFGFAPQSVARRIAWTSMPYLAAGTSLSSWADGLIPNEMIVKLRVDRSYAISEGSSANNGRPAYEWEIQGKEAIPAGVDKYPEVLAAIDVVPNPYYGLSYYENNEFATTVKITNLPAVATVSIYTLDGKFIRRFNRNEMGVQVSASRPSAGITTTQIYPALEWDVKNDKGIPVASGIYLIHVEVPGVGSRTLKWFGVQRQFDPSKL
jgi:hypothetical protein